MSGQLFEGTYARRLYTGGWTPPEASGVGFKALAGLHEQLAGRPATDVIGVDRHPLSMRVAFPPLLMEPSPHVTSGDGNSRSGAAPGRPRAWATPPPAPSPRRLTLKGGFAVVDGQQRRLHDLAHALGFAHVYDYLAARCQQHASLPRMASELATSTPVIRRLLDQAGIRRPPQPVLTAIHRRRATDQRLTLRAAQLGFPTLEAYLTDRLATRAWPLAQVTAELGTHYWTLRRRLDRHQLRRIRRAQARACQARRAARLAELGFASLAAYLKVRHVQQGWSVRRMGAEVRVDRAWLADQMTRLGLRP